MPYVVPKDSVKSPKKVKVSISGSSIVKAGTPKAIPTDLNVFPAGEPQSIPVNEVALINNRPGSGSFAKPKSFTAQSIKVPVGIPEVVLAKDRGSKDQNPFNFSSFGKLQGLKHNVINCITQDSKGNLWFGSYGGGVTKYDGKYFTHFTEKE